MSENQVYVLSIHDRSLNGGYLAFDLKDVLDSLAGLVLQSSWCVLELDAFGDNVEPFCRSVEAQMGRGIWVSGEDLINLAKRIDQTIDGEFLAFHKSTNKSTLSAKDLNLAFFPENEIHLAIVAVDSTYFVVYAKDQFVVAHINARFTTVMLHDPIDYFSG